MKKTTKETWKSVALACAMAGAFFYGKHIGFNEGYGGRPTERELLCEINSIRDELSCIDIFMDGDVQAELVDIYNRMHDAIKQLTDAVTTGSGR